MYSFIQTDNKKILDCVSWLKNRFKLRYNEKDSIVFEYLDAILDFYNESKITPTACSETEEVCKRTFFGFDFVKDESSMFDIGYSEKEKQELRKIVDKILQSYKSLQL